MPRLLSEGILEERERARYSETEGERSAAMLNEDKMPFDCGFISIAIASMGVALMNVCLRARTRPYKNIHTISHMNIHTHCVCVRVYDM